MYKRLLTILLVTVFVGTGFVVSGCKKSADATPNWNTQNYEHYYVGSNATGDALFTTDGINISVLRELMTVINSPQIGGIGAHKTAADFSNFATNDGEIDTIGGGAVYVRLFDDLPDDEMTVFGGDTPLKDFTTYTREGSTGVEGNYMGTPKYWRATYLDNGYLTLWMSDAYRSTPYDDALYQNFYGEEPTGDDYTSGVRVKMKRDFENILEFFPSARSAIDTRGIISQGLVKAAPFLTNQNEYRTVVVPVGDYVYLPSAYEIVRTQDENFSISFFDSIINGTNSVRSGLWKMNGFDRAFHWNVGGQPPSRLTRSAYRTTTTPYDLEIVYIPPIGSSAVMNEWTNGNIEHGVAPAINIKLSALYDILIAQFEDEIGGLNNEIDRLGGVINGLNDDIRDLEDDLDILQGKHDKLEDDIADLEDERDELQRQYNALDDDHADLKEELKTKIKQKQDEIDAKETAIDALDAEITAKETEINDLKTAIQTHQDEIARLVEIEGEYYKLLLVGAPDPEIIEKIITVTGKPNPAMLIVGIVALVLGLGCVGGGATMFVLARRKK